MSSPNPGFSNRLRMGFGKKTQRPSSPPPNQLLQQQQQGQQPPIQQGQPQVGSQRPPSYPRPYSEPRLGRPKAPIQGMPNQQMMGQPQPYGQPPRYPMQPQHIASTGSQQILMDGAMRPSVSEMETNNRRKAQLIVGMYFVSFFLPLFFLLLKQRKKEVLEFEMVSC